MVGWGIFVIILGAGSLLLPQLGIQFRLMELVDDYQPYAGIVVAIIGAGLVLLGMNRRPEAAVAVETGPAPSAAAPVEAPAQPREADPDSEDPYRRP